MKSLTVAEYIIKRLASLGIDSAFGIPGDFSFPIDDAIEKNKQIDWVLCTNELNAAYAADGYARVKGAALLTVTYGVGCLSALNGLMGSYAHRLPVFLVAGSPSERLTTKRFITHHTTGDGDYQRLNQIVEMACCASAVMRPENVIQELERLITIAFRESRPVFISVPSDAGNMPIIGRPPRFKFPQYHSDKKELAYAIEAIAELWKQSKSPIAILSSNIKRFKLENETKKLIQHLKIPYTVMPNDKGVLDESLPNFAGIYAGKFSSPASLDKMVQNSDFVLDLGGIILEQFSSGFFSAQLQKKSHIIIRSNQVQIRDNVFTNLYIKDVILGLKKKLKSATKWVEPKAQQPLKKVGKGKDKLNLPSVLSRIESFLKKDDILFAESGSSIMKASMMKLPEKVSFEGQFLWGSIGWATPATFGACLADTKRRMILITGDGAHQMTLLELIGMGRYGAKPIIFVLDNQVYGAEYVIHTERMRYNEIVELEYTSIPKVLQCKDWYTARVETVQEFEKVLDQLNHHKNGAYIQLRLSPYECKSLGHALIEEAYELAPPHNSKKI